MAEDISSTGSPVSAVDESRSPYGLPLPPRNIQVLSEEEIRDRELLIVGDVHGCYDELRELLDSNHVNKDNTCVVFVGDLVNKGPKSPEVVEYVMKNSWYSVRGNHDEVSLKEQMSEQPSPKLEWTTRLTKASVDWLHSLPYMIHIPSRSIVVVHAGLLPDLLLQEQTPDMMLHMRCVRQRNDSDWEWIREYDNVDYRLWGEAWSGPEHVYFGHDARRFYQKHKFATGLDTACVYGVELTAIYPAEGRVIKVKSKQDPPKKQKYMDELEEREAKNT